MKIQSSAFTDNGTIPQKYTCDGQDVSPQLSFFDVPKEAKSLVLIMDDPDAPMGTWDHWLIWNIPSEITSIDEGSTPPGVVGKNTGGQFAYQGPCPPSGTHRYFFKLYALDATLNIDTSTTKQDLEKAMERHILARAELVGLYER